MREIIVGKKYKMRQFPETNFPDLMNIRVVGKYVLGDGTKIISFRHNGLFPIVSEMEEDKFIKNIVVS